MDENIVKYEHPKCSTIYDHPRNTCNHRCTKPCHPNEGYGDYQARCKVRLDNFSRYKSPASTELLTTSRFAGSMFPFVVHLSIQQGMCPLHRDMHLDLRT